MLRGALPAESSRGSIATGIFSDFDSRWRPGSAFKSVESVMNRLVKVAADLKRAKLDELTLLLREQLDTAEANLVGAENDLERYQVQVATLPSEETSPIVPGLQRTTGTVFGEFFTLRVSEEALQTDIRRLESALEQTLSGDVRAEAYQMIQSVQGSAPLMGR